MHPAVSPRTPHACLAAPCGHPAAHHVATPELANPGEVVVFCGGCRRHEIRRTRRTWFASGDKRRLSRPIGRFAA